MDSTHILVVLRASGGAAVRMAGDLAAQVNGVDSWISFEDWRQQQVMEVQRVRDRKNCKNGHLDEAASTTASASSLTNNGAAGTGGSSGSSCSPSSAEANGSASRTASATSANPSP